MICKILWNFCPTNILPKSYYVLFVSRYNADFLVFFEEDETYCVTKFYCSDWNVIIGTCVTSHVVIIILNLFIVICAIFNLPR